MVGILDLLFDKDFLVTAVRRPLRLRHDRDAGSAAAGAQRAGRTPQGGVARGARNCAPAITPRSTPSAARCGSSPRRYMKRRWTASSSAICWNRENTQGQAGPGRLSRPGAADHLHVLPLRDAVHRVRGGRCSICSWSLHLHLVAADEDSGPPSSARCSALPARPVRLQPIQRRQQSIMRAFPDALDLMLICVESGMSIESAFTARGRRRSARQSAELAEELALTTAELSYLPDRRQAFDNLAKRCGHSGVKAVATALNQAEKYGTPLGQALRVTAHGKSRNAHAGSRTQGRLAARQAHRADDHLLPAVPVRRDFGAGYNPDPPRDALRATAREAGEQVQWTGESVERRELGRAAARTQAFIFGFVASVRCRHGPLVCVL